MKGDFSRQTFDSKKHYSGVLMQQGRVQTDADWNEQEAIERRRIQVETRDVIGPCGAPKDNAGFAVTLSGTTIGIGAGRYYVDGLLAENEIDGLAYESQPDLPGAPDWAALLAKAGVGHALVYLDVWERHITPLDDALTREVALGGPDTATRVKTVWQVRVLPLQIGDDEAKVEELQARRAQVQKKLDTLKLKNANPKEIDALQAELAKIDAVIASLGVPPSCDGSFPDWDALVADPERRMNARTRPPVSPSGPCVVPPTAGYRRLENQLYRVEVHERGALGTATFKWSRDNGSVVTAIERISGKDVTVHDLGPDEVLGFASGQWVEIGDDASELDGKPGQLAQIDAVNSSLRRITLKTAPAPLSAGADGIDVSLHPKLRRWDQNGGDATADGVAMTGSWLPLEDGVEIQFENADFRTGDYWLIPARTATGEIEWPPFAVPNLSPEAQPRRGIHHHFCRLALLTFDATSERWDVVDDCRKEFPPLTEPCCGARALHVLGTNWSNDDAFEPQVLAKEGLRIRLDAPPDPSSLTNDTVQVLIELPFAAGQGLGPETFQRIVWRGVVSRDPADSRVIVWRPREVGLPNDIVRYLRVTLKGHWIWSDRRDSSAARIFLDGQAFGQPGLRADKSPRIDLEFPSGQNTAASDFESWFFFGGRVVAPALQVIGIAFLRKDGKPVIGDLKLPLTPGQKIEFKAGEGVSTVQVTFNRPVLEGSLMGPQGQPNIYVEASREGELVRLTGAMKLVSLTQAIYVVRDPVQFLRSGYMLTCVSGEAGDPAGIVAQDDRSPLDGNYDGQPGGDFKLLFTAV